MSSISQDIALVASINIFLSILLPVMVRFVIPKRVKFSYFKYIIGVIVSVSCFAFIYASENIWENAIMLIVSFLYLAFFF